MVSALLYYVKRSGNRILSTILEWNADEAGLSRRAVRWVPGSVFCRANRGIRVEIVRNCSGLRASFSRGPLENSQNGTGTCVFDIGHFRAIGRKHRGSQRLAVAPEEYAQ